MDGYTASYNRRHAGRAWMIDAWTAGGVAYCPACADRTLSGLGDEGDDAPVPVFAIDERGAMPCAVCGDTIPGHSN